MKAAAARRGTSSSVNSQKVAIDTKHLNQQQLKSERYGCSSDDIC